MSRRASGLRAWFLQRLTAVFLGFYFIYLLLLFLFAPPAHHAAWQAWVAEPLNGTGLLLFVAALLMHSWIGFRDVLIDYVPIFPLRITLLSLLGVGLIACGLWSLRIILTALFV